MNFMRNSVPYVLPDCAADVMQQCCQLDSAILPRAPRVDQSTKRPTRRLCTLPGVTGAALESAHRNKKGPANFAGPFPVLKPVPDLTQAAGTTETVCFFAAPLVEN
jgi:hypothetical protein